MSKEQNTEMTVEQQIAQMSEFSKNMGNNGLYFINKPGVAPALTEETQQEFFTWQEVTKIFMALKAGQLVLTDPKYLIDTSAISRSAKAEKAKDSE